MPASPTDRPRLILVVGEGRGSGKCRALLRALEAVPEPREVRFVQVPASASTPVLELRLRFADSATTMPTGARRPPPSRDRLGRDPLRELVRQRNDPGRGGRSRT